MSHHARAYGAYGVASQLGRAERIQGGIPLVKRIAASLRDRLPESVAQDDLIQAGMLGLIECVDRFESAMGVPFEAYASKRIKGAMVDSLRALDPLPRQQRAELRKAEGVISKLRQVYGREPLESECAREMGMGLGAYQELLGQSAGLRVVDAGGEDEWSHLALGAWDAASGPAEALSQKRLSEKLAELILALPDKEKLVLSLNNDEDLNFKEIGLIMGVSESRVCQVRSKAIMRLRSGLRDWIAHENESVRG